MLNWQLLSKLAQYFPILGLGMDYIEKLAPTHIFSPNSEKELSLRNVPALETCCLCPLRPSSLGVRGEALNEGETQIPGNTIPGTATFFF